MKTEEEMMQELTDGVHRIFENAVRGPLISCGTGKSTQKPFLNSKLCCVTQHKYNSTLAKKERKKESSGNKRVVV